MLIQQSYLRPALASEPPPCTCSLVRTAGCVLLCSGCEHRSNDRCVEYSTYIWGTCASHDYQGNDQRSFREDSCDSYGWLHYDVEKDAAICYLYMKMEQEEKFVFSRKRDPAFISKGFTYWKEVTTVFKKHQESECQLEASRAMISTPKHTIGALLNKEHEKQQEINRKVLLTILQNMKFFAWQGLPLRGSNENADSNFIQLLHLRSTDSPNIIEWINKKSNKYLSSPIQNELIEIMALKISQQVCMSIRDSACYAIMADECTNISN